MTDLIDPPRIRLLFDARRHEEAARAAQAWLAVHPDDVEVLTLLARAQLLLGQHEAALETAWESLHRRPDDTTGQELRALALHNLGRSVEAEAIARRLLAAAPESWQWWRLLSLTVVAPAEAVAAGERAVSLAPEEPLALIALGAALRRARRSAAARDAYRRALAVEPENTAALQGLALLAKRRGQFGDSARGFRAALLADPRSASARANLDGLVATTVARSALGVGLVLAVASAVGAASSRRHPIGVGLAAALLFAVLVVIAVTVVPVWRALGGGRRALARLSHGAATLSAFAALLLPPAAAAFAVTAVRRPGQLGGGAAPLLLARVAWVVVRRRSRR